MMMLMIQLLCRFCIVIWLKGGPTWGERRRAPLGAGIRFAGILCSYYVDDVCFYRMENILKEI